MGTPYERSIDKSQPSNLGKRILLCSLCQLDNMEQQLQRAYLKASSTAPIYPCKYFTLDTSCSDELLAVR